MCFVGVVRLSCPFPRDAQVRQRVSCVSKGKQASKFVQINLTSYFNLILLSAESLQSGFLFTIEEQGTRWLETIKMTPTDSSYLFQTKENVWIFLRVCALWMKQMGTRISVQLKACLVACCWCHCLTLFSLTSAAPRWGGNFAQGAQHPHMWKWHRLTRSRGEQGPTYGAFTFAAIETRNPSKSYRTSSGIFRNWRERPCRRKQNVYHKNVWNLWVRHCITSVREGGGTKSLGLKLESFCGHARTVACMTLRSSCEESAADHGV